MKICILSLNIALCAFAVSLCAVAQPGSRASSCIDEAEEKCATHAQPDAATRLVGAISFGYIYLDSQRGQGQAWDSHLHGFYGIPQFNLKPWIALFADFTQSYNTRNGSHENIQSRLGGLLFLAPPKRRVTLLAFANAGSVRDSKDAIVTDSPAFALGGGWSTRLNSRVSLLIIPAEYVRVFTPGGDLNNFTARVGFTFPLYRKLIPK